MRLVKYIEWVVAVYAIAVGLMFLVDPSMLSAKVYDPWHRAGLPVWGTVLTATSICHFAALLLNGHNIKVSSAIRLMAIILHMFVSVKFAVFFWESHALWGTFLCLYFSSPGSGFPMA